MYKALYRLIVPLIFTIYPLCAFAENIDPNNDGSQYAHGENVGWVNLESGGNGGPGVEVSDFALTPVEVYGVDDLAYDRGTYSETAIVPDSPEPVVDAGKYMVIARRQEDGSWLWTVDMWNSDLPVQQPR